MRKFDLRSLNLYLLVFLGVTIFSLSSCKKKDPEPGPESKLANKEWLTEGVYVGGTKTISPNIKLEFVTATINTLKVNGNPGIGSSWSISGDGKTLDITYPKFDIKTRAFAGFEKKTFTISKLTDSELWFKVSGEQEITLFGLIKLDSKSEYRMNLSGAANKVTSNELTAVTWDTKSDSPNTGYFITGTGEESKRVRQSTEFKFKFGTDLGLNHLTISGIPTPSTWELNSEKTKLKIVYPKSKDKEGGSVEFDVAEITATKLHLKSTNAVTLGILTFAANTDIIMGPEKKDQ